MRGSWERRTVARSLRYPPVLAPVEARFIWDPKLKTIYRAALALAEYGPFTLDEMIAELDAGEELVGVGGAEFVTELWGV